MYNLSEITNTILCGDVKEELAKIPDESVDMCITSPPYLGLRNYQLEPQIWDGNKNCEHVWQSEERYLHRGSTKHSIRAAQDKPGGFQTEWKTQDNFCQKCGAWRGSLGLEPSFELYQKHILLITAELKRVLKKSGQLWWNMGDCYGGQPAGNKSISEANQGYDGVFVRKAKQGQGAKSFVEGFDKKNYGGLGQKRQNTMEQGRGRQGGIANKCLMMMPERISMKMCDEQGWILRNKICWAKQILDKKNSRTIGSVMPTSVKDRFNESWEYLYFFVKNKKYHSDLDAVRLPPQTFENRADGFTRSREFKYDSKRLNDYSPQSKQSGQRFNYRVRDAKRKEGQPQFKASEKEIKQYNEISEDYGKKKLMGIKDKKLGNRWMSGTPNFTKQNKVNDPWGNHKGGLGRKNLPSVWLIGSEPHNFKNELGVEVDHFASFPKALCEVPVKFGCPPKGIVLDPFCGSGTALLVARQLGRNFIGIELNKDYVKLAQARLSQEMLPI